LVANDEIFIQFGKAVQGNPNIFDQNRVYAGFNYPITKNIKTSLGYIWGIQERPSGTEIDYSNIIWGVLTFDNLFSQFKKKRYRIHLMQKKLYIALFILLLPALGFAQQVQDTNYEPTITKPAYPLGKGSLVKIDEAHHNFHTLSNRYLAFAKVLRKDGYEVAANKEAFSEESLQNTHFGYRQCRTRQRHNRMDFAQSFLLLPKKKFNL
jgi:hypothetical protein